MFDRLGQNRKQLLVGENDTWLSNKNLKNVDCILICLFLLFETHK